MKIPTTKSIVDFFFNLPLISSIVGWTKVNSLPGFFRVPIYDIIEFIILELQTYNLTMRANSMAFSFFLSLFPSILVLFTLIPFFLPLFSGFIIPYIPDELIVRAVDGSVDFNGTMIGQINDLIIEVRIIPENVRIQLVDFINAVALSPRFGILSFGFFLAFFFASNGMLTMMNGFEKAQHKSTFVRRTLIQKRIMSIYITVLIGFLVIASIILIILGNTILSFIFDYFEVDQFTEFSVNLLRWITVFALFYFGIALIYRFGVSIKTKIKIFSPGATIATFLSIASSIIFAWYINSFGAYNKLYGTIGTFIVIMLWIQINSFIILVGFELNAAIAVNRDLKKVLKKKKKKKE